MGGRMTHGLSRSDCGSLSAETGLARADLKMSRVFEPVPPRESMPAHDSDHLLPPPRQPAVMLLSRGHTTQIYGEPGLVQRGSGTARAVDAAPPPAVRPLRAVEDRSLLGS
jgi:hypothetical protein